ncbi:MAG: subunit beta of acetophenone carboxylase [Solirubrobacterales bacterium]|jgi:acetone carboxylase gamma subunit|nr:subunit beta of acetophenone carboxylase [Solirubrobacterales bacterium]
MTTAMEREAITEYLEIDLETESWHCRVCDHRIAGARESYKRGLLLYERDPRDIYEAKIDAEYSHAPDPEWCRIVEFYCPGCATQVEVEYLPPGHPITHDIELDIDALAERQKARVA